MKGSRRIVLERPERKVQSPSALEVKRLGAVILYENVPFRECSLYVSRETLPRRGGQKVSNKRLFIKKLLQKPRGGGRVVAGIPQLLIVLRGG
jgi:hypothetical protein